MSADRAKAVFLGAVGLCAGGFVLRVYRGYMQVTMERIAKEPQQPPPVITSGVGERGHELHVITGTDAKHERRLL